MLKALNTSATGMASQEANVNTISNNIANVNTVGFKKSRSEFDDLLYETLEEPGARSSADTAHTTGVQIGSGSKITANRKIFSQGDPQITNNPYDLMINGGDGFFGIITPKSGIKFSRNGSFSVDKDGNLTTKAGLKVVPGIVVPPNTVNLGISEDGKVQAYIKNQLDPQDLGQIPLFTFVNSAGLRSEGGNLYGATSASGAAIQQIPGDENAGTIMQGALESSNVSVMNEMTNLIKAQRAYEMNSKVMGVADQMLQTVNTIR